MAYSGLCPWRRHGCSHVPFKAIHLCDSRPLECAVQGHSHGFSWHLQVVGQTYQQLETPSPRTYIGSGKVEEVVGAVAETGAETLIFDDELTPGQLRNLERALGDRVRICDRTALILDIFSQRAATREGQLQVGLANLTASLISESWSFTKS